MMKFGKAGALAACAAFALAALGADLAMAAERERAGVSSESELIGSSDTASVRGGRKGLIGGGRIGEPLPDRTVPSPSDFAVAVDDQGGTFLCSMAGPDCSGFLDLQLMMIQGRVEPGELSWRGGRKAIIEAVGTVVLVTSSTPPVATVIDGVPYVAEFTIGGPGKATLHLTIPDFEPLIADYFGTSYGATGGFVEFGDIKHSLVHAPK